jgi:hypothetical protein
MAGKKGKERKKQSIMSIGLERVVWHSIPAEVILRLLEAIRKFDRGTVESTFRIHTYIATEERAPTPI